MSGDDQGDVTRPFQAHWSEVLSDVADLGAQIAESRQEAAMHAAEASEDPITGSFPILVIGEPPPRQVRRRVVRRVVPATDAPETVRIDLRTGAPVITEAPSVHPPAGPVADRAVDPGIVIGAPPARQIPGRAGAPPGLSTPPADEVVEWEEVWEEVEEAPAATAGRGRRLLKDNAVVAAGTALSRITGVVRLLAVYGLSTDLRDTYLLANNTPNIIYELILGGVLTATLVPLFTQHLEKNDEDSTNAVVSATLVALVGLTLVAFIVAPLLMLLYGANLDDGIDRGQYLRVGIWLSVLFVPQVFFYGAMALGSALLNSRRRFFAAAWAPVLNNVIVVAALVVAAAWGTSATTLESVDDSMTLMAILGLGTTAGIAGMAISLLPALYRAKIRLRFRPSLRHPAVRAAAGLSGWTLGYVITNQIAGQTVNVLAFGESGTVANYQVGFIFFQLPHGLLAVSLMTTFQPDLARAFVRDDWPDFHARLLQGLRLLVAVMAPASIGYLTLSVLTVHLNEGTAYEGGSSIEVARALAGFAPGLLGFSVYLFVLRAFYATQDTKRPFWINAGENLLNIVAAFLLVVAFPVGRLLGLSSAYSIAYLLGAAMALAILLRHLPNGFDLAGFVGTLVRCLLSTAVMAGVVAAVVLAMTSIDGELLPVALLVGVGAGVVAYALSALVTGVVRDAGLSRRLPGPLGRLSR